MFSYQTHALLHMIVLCCHNVMTVNSLMDSFLILPHTRAQIHARTSESIMHQGLTSVLGQGLQPYP